MFIAVSARLYLVLKNRSLIIGYWESEAHDNIEILIYHYHLPIFINSYYSY